MGRFSTSFNLVKLAFSIINKEKELLVYSILSAISVIILIISFFAFFLGLSFAGFIPEAQNEASQGVFDFIFYILFYFLLSFVALFFNTAIITSANRALNGEKNRFMDGIRDAFSNIGKIFIWAFISAFLSTIIKMIQDRVPFVAKIIVGIVGAVWNLATFFAFPMMILDKKSVGTAIKESPKLFAKTWGENIIINVGVGFFFGIMFIVLLIISVILVFLSLKLSSMVLGVFTALFIILGFVLLILLSMTCDVVINTILYHYANTGVLPIGLKSEVFDSMMHKGN